MKRFLIIAFVASVLSSCAVTKTRTARTADISSEITQMPTVVELDVADKREKSDVFEWANRMFSFKRRIGVKEKTQEAVAQILERTDADVLIEPKVSVDRRIKPFATDYTLSVSGYPAKYKAFRTATVEDIETVNALRKPAEHRTIRIADYMRPHTAHLSRQTRNTVAIADAVTKKPRWERKSGYMGMVDAGFILGCKYGAEDGLHISTTHGALIAHRFFLGLGLAYQVIPDLQVEQSHYSGGRYGYYYTSLEGDTAHMLNGFFNFRAYALKRRVSPFLDARVGINYSTQSHDGNSEIGLYWDAGIGLSVGRFNVSGVYAQYANTDGFKIKIGVTF